MQVYSSAGEKVLCLKESVMRLQSTKFVVATKYKLV
jgi:hypothetical protein